MLAFASCAALVAAFLPLASGSGQRARVLLVPPVMAVVAVAFAIVRGHVLDTVLSLFVAASMGLALSTVGNRKTPGNVARALAKRTTGRLLADLGWLPSWQLDIGGITTARGQEHFALLFMGIAGGLDAHTFNIKVVTRPSA